MKSIDDKNIVFATPAVLPDGNGGFNPCPELLTEAEAIRYLRFDIDGPARPENTLRYYREKKKLKGTQILTLMEMNSEVKRKNGYKCTENREV